MKRQSFCCVAWGCSLLLLLVCLIGASNGDDMLAECTPVSTLVHWNNETDFTAYPCIALIDATTAEYWWAVDSTWAEVQQILYILGYDTAECQIAAAEFLCGANLLLCGETTPPSNDTGRTGPCRSKCYTFFEHCQDTLDLFGVDTGINCTDFDEGIGTDPFTGQQVACYELEFTAEQRATMTPFYGCPQELVTKNGMCNWPCPFVVWTEDQLYINDNLSTAFFSISLIATLFFLITQLGRAYGAKKNPSENIFWMGLSAFLLSFLAFVAMCWGWNDVRCDDDITINETHCVAWAFFFTWFALCLAVWYFQTIFNMMMCVLLQRASLGFVVTIVYHICGWGLPLVAAIIMAAADKLGYEGTDWCLPRSDDPDDPESTVYWSFFFFYLPFSVSVSLALICNFIVVCWIWKWGGWAGLKIQIRTIVMGVLLMPVFLFSMIIFYHRWVNTAEMGSSFEEYFECIWTQPDTFCEWHHPLPYANQFLATMASASAGGAMTVLLGTRVDDFKFWINGFKNLFARKNFFHQSQQAATASVGSRRRDQELSSEGSVKGQSSSSEDSD